jgi:acyl carrier protein
MSGVLTDTKICSIIGSAIAHEDKDHIVPSMDLRRDLGVDSVGLMSIVYVLEEQTGMDAFSHVDEFIGAEQVADIIEIVRQS